MSKHELLELPGDGCTVEYQWPGVAGCTSYRDDKAEQMRRAIVVAAANIGNSLKILEK